MTSIGAWIDRRQIHAPWRLDGTGALLAAIFFLASMPLWAPSGATGVNNLAFPIILAPLIWAVAFVFAALEASLTRAGAVMAAAIGAPALNVGHTLDFFMADTPVARSKSNARRVSSHSVHSNR